MKEFRFKAIMAALSVAYGEIDALIWRIRKDFENGVIPAARARREYATARARFMVIGARYYRVAKAAYNYDPFEWKRFESSRSVEMDIFRHDEYFNN